MAFFVTKDGKRKSPMALAIFFVVLLYCFVYGLAYALLVEPLYTYFSLGRGAAETIVHCFIIALVGTAVCCLLFLLPDKRVVPYSYAALPIVPIMLFAASLQLDSDARSSMQNMILLYTVMPVIVGNLVSWLIYHRRYRKKKRV